MASAKQIAWRKKFARMAKSGKFRSAKKEVKKNVLEMDENKRITLSSLDRHMKDRFKGKSDAYLRRIIRTKKGNTDDEGYELTRRIKESNPHNNLKSMTQDEKTREIEKDVRQHMQWNDAKRKYGYGTVDLLQFYFNVPYRMRLQLGLPKTPPKYGQSPA